MTMPLLAVENLEIEFVNRTSTLRAVRDVSFSVEAGETLAIVGESGCGKSLTALSLLGLINSPGRVRARVLAVEGRDMLSLSPEELRLLRGSRIAMIFQEPMTALNPVLTVGEQIGEVICEHEDIDASALRERVIGLLQRVRIPDPERRYHEYPHRLSGGMRQRVMIAMAIACSPRIIVADEPTTALDVTVQAQILELLDELKRAGTAIVLITHDLAVVCEYADRVLVMYAGRKVEEREVGSFFRSPRHPYARGLLRARPSLTDVADGVSRLEEIRGIVPPLHDMPPGCAFAPRCPHAADACCETVPPLAATEDGLVACFRSRELFS